jgi:hypothetical protein
MQIAPPRYLVLAIIDALAPEVRSWFEDTVTGPIPEELVAILRRMDTCAGRTRSTAMETA